MYPSRTYKLCVLVSHTLPIIVAIIMVAIVARVGR
jgi:hypothetical protein